MKKQIWGETVEAMAMAMLGVAGRFEDHNYRQGIGPKARKKKKAKRRQQKQARRRNK